MPALVYRPASNNPTATGANSTDTTTSLRGQFTILHSGGSTNTSVMSMQPLTSDTMRFAITGLTRLDGEYLLLAKNNVTQANNGSSTGGAGGAGGKGNVDPGTSLRSAGSEKRYVDALLTYMVTSIWVLLVACALAI